MSQNTLAIDRLRLTVVLLHFLQESLTVTTKVDIQPAMKFMRALEGGTDYRWLLRICSVRVICSGEGSNKHGWKLRSVKQRLVSWFHQDQFPVNHINVVNQWVGLQPSPFLSLNDRFIIGFTTLKNAFKPTKFQYRFWWYGGWLRNPAPVDRW